MAIRDEFLLEFDREMASTRKVLERVPELRFDWRPHPKSWTARELATFVSLLPGWGTNTIELDSLDIMPGGKPAERPKPVASSAELLAQFDENVTAARAALAGADDAHLKGMWSLKAAGQTLSTMPRTAVLRYYVLNHLVHHRAQLGVYLRLLDVPVPAIYGPTADEGGMF